MENTEMNIHQKILKIASMAGVLRKSKKGYSYSYTPEEDIQAKVTAGLQKYGVMLYHEIVPGSLKVTPYTYEKYDKTIKGVKPVNEVIVQADTVYTWVNVDNPDERIVTPYAFVAQMEDAAQAMGAGETYANRYYLMKSLQLATTESDPDNYRNKQIEAEKEEDKKAVIELESSISEVVAMGTQKIANGMPKEKMRELTAKHNNGNGNPSSIKNVEICKAILEELKKI